MNLCPNFHSNSRRDISLKATDVNLKVALEEKSEDHQSHQHPWTITETINKMLPTKFYLNLKIVVEKVLHQIVAPIGRPTD